MNKLSDILWKFFASIIVFSGRSLPDANAEEFAQNHTLCRAGYYVSKCGEHNVGINWLKGYPASETAVMVNAATEQSTHVANGGAATRAARLNSLISGIRNSPNYYDYAEINNLKNLRYFFSDAGHDIIYTTSSGTRQVAQYDAYKDIRNNLLTATCNPVQVQIVCSQCPGIATVPASTVRITYDSGLLISNSWNFHTIADCYMQEFKDSTGIYEYVDNYQDRNTQNCYYSQNVGGDTLIDENTAGESQYE